MDHQPVTLSLHVPELEVLPEVATVAELLVATESCWAQVLPEYLGPASGIAPGAVGQPGGPHIPEDWSADPEVWMRPLTFVKVVGAYYFPEFGVVIDLHGRAFRSAMNQASYYTPDLLQILGIIRIDDRIVYVPPPDLRQRSSAFVTMPWGAIYNYGHFVADCLPAVVASGRLPRAPETELVFPKLTSWQREHLELLGVEPRELKYSQYFVEEAFFTSCMATHLESPNRSYQWLSEASRTAVSRPSGDVSPANRKVYISRQGNGKRIFLNEAELETALEARGFEVIQPETLSVRDQIALYASAAVVVGPAGSGFANALFCSPGTVVVEIKPEGMRSWWVRNICLQVGARWSPYFCENVPVDQPMSEAGEARAEAGIAFRVEPADFLRHVERAVATREPLCSR